MKTLAKLTRGAVALLLLTLADTLAARPTTVAPKVVDPTKFDCRVAVRTRTVEGRAGRKIVLYRVMECPHKDKLAAGQCETSWLWGMRCKN